MRGRPELRREKGNVDTDPSGSVMAQSEHPVMTDDTKPSADNKVGWGGWKKQWV